MSVVEAARETPQNEQASYGPNLSGIKEDNRTIIPVSTVSHTPRISNKARSQADVSDDHHSFSRTPVNDSRFFSDVRFLKILQQIIVSNRIKLSEEIEHEIYLGRIRMLIFASPLQRLTKSRKCRAPTLVEIKEVERKIIILESSITDDRLIRRASIKHISGTILEKLGLLLLTFSIIFLISAVCVDNNKPPMFLALFSLWSATTGALGSAALLYVNALSIQVDPNVDVTSRTLVVMRMILGALFAVILALPFGQGFHKFLENQSMEASDSLLLLLPFILGFSTPLVLSILGRFIQSARTFFGLREQSDHPSGFAERTSGEKDGLREGAGYPTSTASSPTRSQAVV